MVKEILTVQNIQSDLRYMLRGAIVLTVVSALFTVFAVWALFYIVFAEGTLRVTFNIILLTILNKPGRIVTDRVVGMEEKDHYFNGYGHNHSYHLYFASYGEHVIPAESYRWSSLYALDRKTIYFYAECDDEFYLVLSKPHTGKILLAYNTKMFDYQPQNPDK